MLDITPVSTTFACLILETKPSSLMGSQELYAIWQVGAFMQAASNGKSWPCYHGQKKTVCYSSADLFNSIICGTLNKHHGYTMTFNSQIIHWLVLSGRGPTRLRGRGRNRDRLENRSHVVPKKRSFKMAAAELGYLLTKLSFWLN